MALNTLKCNHLTPLRFNGLTECEEWSQFVVDYFVGNLTYLLVVLGHQTFLATAVNTL